MKILLPRTLEPLTIPWTRMTRATALSTSPLEMHRLKEVLDRFAEDVMTIENMDRTAQLTTEELGKTLSDLKARYAR